MTFGEKLREAREAEKLAAETLGALVGVTGQAVSSWELGHSRPAKKNLALLRLLFPNLPEVETYREDAPDGGKGITRNVGNRHAARKAEVVNA